MTAVKFNEVIRNDETGITITNAGTLSAGQDLARIVNVIKCAGTGGTVTVYNRYNDQTFTFPIAGGETIFMAYSKLVSATASDLYWAETASSFIDKAAL